MASGLSQGRGARQPDGRDSGGEAQHRTFVQLVRKGASTPVLSLDRPARLSQTNWVDRTTRLREDVLARLRQHYSHGDLRLGTFEHRVERVLSAHGVEELAQLTWDLPDEQSPFARVIAWLIGEPTVEEYRRCELVRFFCDGPLTTLALGGDAKTWSIGRDPASAVLLEDQSVSRQHAMLSVRAGRCWVRDLCSLNGTFVNGRAVTSARLQPGDSLRLGAVTAIVR